MNREMLVGDSQGSYENSSGSNDGKDAERQNMKTVLNAFRFYRKYALRRLNETEKYIASLVHEDQYLLTKYRAHLTDVRKCIDCNQSIIQDIMIKANVYSSAELDLVNNSLTPRNGQNGQNGHDEVEDFKILKAQSTLKLISRDWSSNGSMEREQSYVPIINAVKEFFPRNKFGLNEVRILVPGAGLGRLTYDLACLGYDCEGNEFSYFMLIVSHFILNHCSKECAYVLYPWIDQYVNNLRRSDQVAAVRFPDVCPKMNPPAGNIIITAGDFLEVYFTPNVYDCVVTCFFIDCANNVIDFIRRIYKILMPGGIWINLGPLLYHYSDINGENSIEPTYEDLVAIIDAIGFQFLRKKTGIITKYAQNPTSMQQSEYESVFWICRKPDHENGDFFNDNERARYTNRYNEETDFGTHELFTNNHEANGYNNANADTSTNQEATALATNGVDDAAVKHSTEVYAADKVNKAT